jgi:hypothetical protein
MIDIADKIVAEIQSMSEIDADEMGLVGILDLKGVNMGDPGILPVHMFPFAYVEAVVDEDGGETMGRYKRDYTFDITLMLNYPEHYEQDSTDRPGERQLILAGTAIRDWFMRYSNRRLDWMPNVIAVFVPEVRYDTPSRPGSVRIRSARIRLTVRIQHGRVQ